MRRNVRAVVMAEVGTRGYREYPTENAIAFTVDGAMDTDSDAFSLDIGDPFNSLRKLINRDTEVRAAIFTGQTDARARIVQLAWGVADTVQMSSDDHYLSMEGRDYTSIAVDSHHPPGQWNHIRPHTFVTRDAKKLHIPELQLAKVSAIPKFYTDGSETYWEVWYRMYRKKKMWIWAEPDGTLIADTLNYDTQPRYYFGVPKDKSNSRFFIPVERCVVISSKQRAAEVWVFGERDGGQGNDPVGFIGKAKDPSIKSWKRQPLKILQASRAKNSAEARREAWEEIFEGKVGALEIVLTVPDPGFVIKQNEMAQVRIPDLDLHGRFFVVGNQVQGGPDGYRQIVRLREKNFAVSKRIPTDPQLNKDPGDQRISGTVGGALRMAPNVRWGNAFASASQEFHDGWPMAMFLGVLLSICHHETHFKNVRGGDGDREWYPKPIIGQGGDRKYADDPPSGNIVTAADVQLWKKRFANKQSNPLNPRYPSSECAVGPMQLVTPGYKVWADEYGGLHDEYGGGRWNPNANIRAGARAFAGKLSGLDPQKTSNIWIGVERYYGGTAAATAAYRRAVKALYEDIYKAIAEGAIEQGSELPPGEGTHITIPGGPEIVIPADTPPKIKKAINYALRQLGKPYKWGAYGPNQFDCSGLVYAAYSFAGLGSGTTPRWGRTNTHGYFGDSQFKKITRDNLSPGDMVFFHGVEHMGMYLIDNYFIHAPHTGDVVKISAMGNGYYRDNYNGGRRVINWAGGD